MNHDGYFLHALARLQSEVSCTGGVIRRRGARHRHRSEILRILQQQVPASRDDELRRISTLCSDVPRCWRGSFSRGGLF